MDWSVFDSRTSLQTASQRKEGVCVYAEGLGDTLVCVSLDIPSDLVSMSGEREAAMEAALLTGSVSTVTQRTQRKSLCPTIYHYDKHVCMLL